MREAAIRRTAARVRARWTEEREGGGDRVGNRQVPNSPSGTNRSAFGGSGTSGRAARASSREAPLVTEALAVAVEDGAVVAAEDVAAGEGDRQQS